MSVSDAYTALIRQNYRAYCYHVHRGAWIPSRVGSYLCERVQEFIERPTTGAYEILILSMPPQHGKSLTITETLPSWYIARNPRGRVIEISYSEDFAQLFGRRNKAKLEEFGSLFGVQLASSPNSATEFETTEGGGMISRGITSGVTGRPASVMIIDDPIKTRQEAESETHRRRIWEEWESSFRTRLQAGAKVIVIQTRWHEDDFAGRLIANEGERCTVINLPCEAEADDPLGRPVGAPLCPEIGKDAAWLADFKKAYTASEGGRAWAALFQGHPTAATGNLFRREWWQYYDTAPEMMQTILSVDATFKDGNENDFVALQVWGKRAADCYLVDAYKGHLNFPETLRMIRSFCEKYPAMRIKLIEDKANGPAIIQMLRHEIPGIVAVNPEGGKVARANAVVGAIEAGNVYLPRYAAFTADFVEECAAFPAAAHDDQVDAMTQALNRLLYFSAAVPEPEKPRLLFHIDTKPRDVLGKGSVPRVI